MMSADPCARSMDTSAPAAPAAPATRRSWNGRAPRGERESEAMSGHGPCARTCAAPPLPDPAGDALRQLHSNGLVRGRGGAHGSGGGGGALGMGGRGHGRPEGAHLVAVPHDVSLPRQVVVHQAPAGAQRSSARAAPAGPRETAGKGGGQGHAAGARPLQALPRRRPAGSTSRSRRSRTARSSAGHGRGARRRPTWPSAPLLSCSVGRCGVECGQRRARRAAIRCDGVPACWGVRARCGVARRQSRIQGLRSTLRGGPAGRSRPLRA